jgi:hypothetical protein
MNGTLRLVWLLAAVLIVLTPMAWASPVDPSWIAGVYDGGDFDDAVNFLTSGSLAVTVLPVADLSPMFGPVPTEVVRDQQPGAAGFLASHAPRAPPLS